MPRKACRLTPAERGLLIEIEKDGKHGAVPMRGLNKAAKGLIGKGLAYKIGRIGGGLYVYSTVAGSACLGIDWDKGPRPKLGPDGQYIIKP